MNITRAYRKNFKKAAACHAERSTQNAKMAARVGPRRPGWTVPMLPGGHTGRAAA